MERNTTTHLLDKLNHAEVEQVGVKKVRNEILTAVRAMLSEVKQGYCSEEDKVLYNATVLLDAIRD